MILTWSFAYMMLCETFDWLAEQKLQSPEPVMNYEIHEFLFLN